VQLGMHRSSRHDSPACKKCVHESNCCYLSLCHGVWTVYALSQDIRRAREDLTTRGFKFETG
jgi:hypothetical protein